MQTHEKFPEKEYTFMVNYYYTDKRFPRTDKVFVQATEDGNAMFEIKRKCKKKYNNILSYEMVK